MSNFEEYKPLESEYNIRVAVENLKKAYWNNEPEKVAKDFTDAEDIIIGAICLYGYTVSKERPQGEWEHWGSPFSDEQVVYSIVCSVCGARFVEIQGEIFNFCPNCGAQMKTRTETD